jgi:hypothetical protein
MNATFEFLVKSRFASVIAQPLLRCLESRPARALKSAPVLERETPASSTTHGCSNESCKLHDGAIAIPPSLLGRDGRALERFRRKDHDGFFVSGEGYVYCTRKCWADYCD